MAAAFSRPSAYHAESPTRPPSEAACTARGSEKKPRWATTPASTTLASPSMAAAAKTASRP